MPKASEAAAHALAADDQDAEVLAAAAGMKAMFEWDWYGAESLFRRALLANPANEYTKHLYALFVLLPQARLDEALEMVDEARRLDPLSLFASANRAAVLLLSRRVDEAEAESRRALELNPDFWRAMLALGRCQEARGRHDDAITYFERARVASEGVPSAIGALGRAYALAGRTQDARALLKQLDEESQSSYVSAYTRVLIYLGLGDEQVFDWLERSYNEHVVWLIFLPTDPRFDPLRSDARFQNLLKKMGLPLIDRVPV
jgi:tetratricopeptide (TPR) repeat protein